MDIEEAYSNLISSDKLRFQKICRKLLKSTFIVKDKDHACRSDFFFIARPTVRPLFSQYFQMIGYDIVVDETAGVAMLVNGSNDESGGLGSNRRRLKLYESVILCALWLIYESKMTSGGLGAVIIHKSELDMEIERLGFGGKIDKNKMQDTLELFEDFELIEVNGKVTDLECNIKLFASLQFCLSGEEFKSFVTSVVPKFKENSSQSAEIENNGVDIDEF